MLPETLTADIRALFQRHLPNGGLIGENEILCGGSFDVSF
jgi:hypothetical protein